jgi:PKD repeat protein
VFNGLSTWNDNFEAVEADFTYTSESPFEYEFKNTSTESNTAYWDFGDGTYDIKYDVVGHTYESQGTYSVTHIAYRGWESDTITKQVIVGTVGFEETSKINFKIFPNPATNSICITGKDIQSIEIFSLFNKLEGDFHFAKKEKALIDISELKKGIYIVLINN